jgi:hypothetical protein
MAGNKAYLHYAVEAPFFYCSSVPKEVAAPA